MPPLSDLHERYGHLLTFAGKGYGSVMRIREKLYEQGTFSQYRSSVPTVSVGNISMGGSGKTPLCSWIMEHALNQGILPVLLTRGYKAEPPVLPYLLSDESTPREAGDEPLMLARFHPAAEVVVDPKRVRAARFAEKKLAPGLFILDDGFQHMSMGRDVNLALMRPKDFTGQWNRVFPAGQWREPVSALHRADAFPVRCEPEQFARLEPVIRRKLEPFNKPVYHFFIKPESLQNLATGALRPTMDKTPYLLVSGIGDPAQAAVTAEKLLGCPPAVHIPFRDHHNYTPDDVKNISAAARSHDCARIVTTPKDAVKIGPIADDTFWTLRSTVEFGSVLFTDVPFDDFLNQALVSATIQKEKKS